MDTRMKINTLLKKYYDGETTREEEKLLRDKLKSIHQDNDEQLLNIQFQVLDEMKKDSLSLDFEQKLKNSLYAERTIKKSKMSYYLSGVAAVIAIIAVSTMLFFSNGGDFDEDTYQDPQKAYNATKIALTAVSANLNKGLKEVSKVKRINTEITKVKNLNSIFVK